MTYSKKPLIGITLDYKSGGGYSALPWYALRQNYCSSIAAVGGIPLPLPYQSDQIKDYIEFLDGLIVTGGNFDIPPHLFGDDSLHQAVKTNPERTAFEFELTKQMLDNDKPVFGICGGMQLINVALGGSLIQHIPDEIENCLPHEQAPPHSNPGHFIRIAEGTLLHKIVQETKAAVNTAHHQAVKNVAPGLIANAWAEDGIIEGIESLHHKYCLGVQWHPEYHVGAADTVLFDHFVKTCAQA